MFCRNCGEQMNDNAQFCVKCGVARGAGNQFCANCGKPVNPNQAVCLNCGCQLNGSASGNGGGAANGGIGGKSKVTAGLLGIFLGCFGVHNFYLGYTTKAIIQVCVSGIAILLSCCTVGLSLIATLGIGIWGLVEGILILTGKISTDGKGNPLV